MRRPALFIFGDLEHLVFESELYGSCPESRGTAVRKWARSRVTTVQICGSDLRSAVHTSCLSGFAHELYKFS